jgi:hypothetical protein
MDDSYDDPPVPTGATDLAELVRRLDALWSWAGRPSEEALRPLAGVRRTASGFVVDGLPAGTVERILGGNEAAWEPVEPFVVACLRIGGHTEDQTPDVDRWREAWQVAGPTVEVHPAVSGAPAQDEPDDSVGQRASVLLRRATSRAADVVARVRRQPRQPADPPGPSTGWRVPLAAAAGVAVLITVGAAIAVSGTRHRSSPPESPQARASAAVVASATASPVPAPTTTAPQPDPSTRIPPPTPAAPGPVPTEPSTTASGAPFFISSSVVNLNAGSGHGCKGWMNGRNPGPFAQSLVQSWGDDCEMALWRSKDGGKKFYIMSGKHRIRSGSDYTNFYWDGPGYQARVCVNDFTTGQSACGSPYAG